MEIDLRNKKVGDIIDVGNNINLCLRTHHELMLNGIETDFVYRYNGKDGLWLQVTSITKQK